ncbi:MAG TPA: ABC transporter ATP-binding protein [Acidimicrobiales bacterium]|nr:ABC transporter ATP-binding protein [Acidimicrobiales bacterium]
MSRLSQRLRGAHDANRWRWALRDVDIKIDQGDAVGLFGTNGSGKSTLLKILTRVMYPTAGNVRIGGRVGALIEVRAGIHPDLTGRENVFLYGSILGLRRSEIAKRFDAIVDFADLSDAINRQVKFYSSGMAMRLGFGVAAFLEPHVLLVDEVLAVGDATFQQRCLDRMRVVLNQGTTLVFVSHDLASVESISTRGVWLRQGIVAADGPIRDSLSAYRSHIESAAEVEVAGAGQIGISAVVSGSKHEAPATQEPLHVALRLRSSCDQRIVLFIGISEGSAAPVFSLRREYVLDEGVTETKCVIGALPLPRGRYFAWAAITDPAGADLTPWHPVTCFDVLGPDLDAALPGVMRLSPVHVDARWEEISSPVPFRLPTEIAAPRQATGGS